MSKTDIFNDVLLTIGVTPTIDNADTDDSVEAITIRATFDSARRTVLRDHNWGFANSRETLTLVGTPPPNWACQYAYPADCVKAIEIEKIDRRGKPIAFKVASYEDDDNGRIKVILTDQAEAVLIFTRDEEDVSLFDDQFSKTLAAYIGFRAAKTLTTDKNAPTEAWNAYTRAKFEATTSDSNEQIQDDPRDAEWIVNRN